VLAAWGQSLTCVVGLVKLPATRCAPDETDWTSRW